ncbi:hypothetical protein HanIR_Chr17g0865901 [Helianthus annuus]|nr:hypothetical protein HanIR_Chr17g0865901 [Helianthus annuus]
MTIPAKAATHSTKPFNFSFLFLNMYISLVFIIVVVVVVVVVVVRRRGASAPEWFEAQPFYVICITSCNQFT